MYKNRKYEYRSSSFTSLLFIRKLIADFLLLLLLLRSDTSTLLWPPPLLHLPYVINSSRNPRRFPPAVYLLRPVLLRNNTNPSTSRSSRNPSLLFLLLRYLGGKHNRMSPPTKPSPAIKNATRRCKHLRCNKVESLGSTFDAEAGTGGRRFGGGGGPFGGAGFCCGGGLCG